MEAERALIQAAAAGDRDAFDQLVQRYQSSIVGLARTVGGGTVDAEDVAQEVFVRVWRGLAGFRGESSFRTWLYRIALNVIRTHQGTLARVRRILAPPRQDPSGEAADPIEATRAAGDLERDVVLRDAIDKALATLPAEMRAALVLRDVEGLDYREIADTLGVPIGTVESRIFRARQRLRPLLEPLRH